MEELKKCLVKKGVKEEDIQYVLDFLKNLNDNPLEALKSNFSSDYIRIIHDELEKIITEEKIKIPETFSHEDLLRLKGRIIHGVLEKFIPIVLEYHHVEAKTPKEVLKSLVDHFSKSFEVMKVIEMIDLRKRVLFFFHPSNLGIEFIEYKERKKGKLALSYFGDFNIKEAERSGKGREYENYKYDKTVIVVYEGHFKNGKRDGRGESFDMKSMASQRGIWKNGVMEEDLSQQSIVIVPFQEIRKLFSEENKVGSGGYGNVYKVRSSEIPYLKTDDEFVAVKLMKVEGTYMKQMLIRITKRGVSLARSIQSKYVLGVHGMVQGVQQVGVIMEYGPVSMDRLIAKGGIPKKDKLTYLYEVACGMKALHARIIMHRDLKWCNIFKKSNGQCLISDFDTMKEDEVKWRMKSIQQSSNIGTPGYLAPEVFLGKDYSLKSDIFSYGMMIYCLLFECRYPYINNNVQCNCGAKMNRILSSNSIDYHVAQCDLRPFLSEDDLEKFPTELIEVMNLCWDKDPEKRPNFADIVKLGIFGQLRLEEGGEMDEIENCIVLLRYPKHGLIDDERIHLSRANFKDLIGSIERNIYITKVLSVSDAKNGTSIEDDKDVVELLKNEDPVVNVELDTSDAKKLEKLLKGITIEEEEILSVFLRKEIEQTLMKEFLKKEKNEKELVNIYTVIRETIEKEYQDRLHTKYAAILEDEGLKFLIQNRFLKFMERIDLRYEKLEDDGFSIKKLLSIFKRRPETENHLYFGQVSKLYRQVVPHGFGIQFLEKYISFFKNTFFPVYVGEFDLNNKSGKGKIFNKARTRIFDGEFENNQKNGKGVEYTLTKFKDVGIIPSFQGVFKNGKRSGFGEEYDCVNGKSIRGRWEMGVLNPDSVHRFDCPLANYEDMRKYLNEDSFLGGGGYGSVYQVKRSVIRSLEGFEDDEYVAVKKMNMEKFNTRHSKTMLHRMMRRGIGLRSLVRNEHLLKIFAVFLGHKQCGCIMEFADGGDIRKKIQKGGISDTTKREYLKQTAKGMFHFHSEGIMHRDLKWENVMLKDDIIKITDFDTVKDDETIYKFSVATGTANIGTTGYVAPEIFAGVGRQYTLAVDVYAFGMMIYCLLFEETHPYFTERMKMHVKCNCNVQMKQIIQSKNLDYHVANHDLRPRLIPEQVDRHPQFLIDLMLHCWEPDPFQRPSFEDIVFRFDIEEKSGMMTRNIRLQFPKHKGVNEQKTFLVKPFKVSVLKNWIKKKFTTPKVKPEIKSLVHSVVGSIIEDTDLEKVLDLNKEDPIIFVELSEIDEEYAVNEYTRKITYEEYRILKEKCAGCENELKISHEKIKTLLERNEEMEKENKKLRKMLRREENEKFLKEDESDDDEKEKLSKIHQQTTKKKKEEEDEETEGED